jgi:hypothetical protein
MRQVLITKEIHPHMWFAFDIDPQMHGSRYAKGMSEDIAVSNWWALHNTDDKYPRRGRTDMVDHSRLVNPEVVEHTEKLA